MTLAIDSSEVRDRENQGGQVLFQGARAPWVFSAAGHHTEVELAADFSSCACSFCSGHCGLGSAMWVTGLLCHLMQVMTSQGSRTPAICMAVWKHRILRSM